ncbi:type II secretion system protein GspL [Legionella fairfieldensis]|uniref:type II secretion system protein GspL n=1 Tax=Legionella fairfieldensis TaxID=45064 RepID=UPI00068518E6|nr:type II secretion system protein GspL [Legionella fairfieldensis]
MTAPVEDVNVDTCFLFAQHLNEEGCLSLCLDQQGKLIAPLAQRSFIEIIALQTNNSQTIIVISGKHFSFHQLELARLSDKKARVAIPYALEDKLAQSVDTLHFAFSRDYYQNGHYLVLVSDKIYLQELIKTLKSHEIYFNTLTVDWFALKISETAVLDTGLLVNSEAFKGALSLDLSTFYGEKEEEAHTFYVFPDSNKAFSVKRELSATEIHESSCHWLAQRLQQIKPINLCQGDLQLGKGQTKTKRLYQAAIGMSLLWLLSFLVVNIANLYVLNQQIAAIDTEIAIIYREFFPQSQQVISPKFRISQLIKANQNHTSDLFWLLLNKLSNVFKSAAVTIEQLRFQNQTLLVTLSTKNFESLEALQTRLQQAKVKVKQTQASTHDAQVVSTLELSL